MRLRERVYARCTSDAIKGMRVENPTIKVRVLC